MVFCSCSTSVLNCLGVSGDLIHFAAVRSSKLPEILRLAFLNRSARVKTGAGLAELVTRRIEGVPSTGSILNPRIRASLNGVTVASPFQDGDANCWMVLPFSF